MMRRWQALAALIERDCGAQGPLTLLALRPAVVLERARKLVLEHQPRTLDAIHLAVALEECPALADGEDVVFVTRDQDQAAVASAVGLAVR